MIAIVVTSLTGLAWLFYTLMKPVSPHAHQLYNNNLSTMSYCKVPGCRVTYPLFTDSY